MKTYWSNNKTLAKSTVDYGTSLKLVRDWYANEFNEYDNDIDVCDVGLAYSTDDDDNDVQVSANLIACVAYRYVNGDLTEVWHFSNREKFDAFLRNLDFCALIDNSQDYWIEKLFTREFTKEA